MKPFYFLFSAVCAFGLTTGALFSQATPPVREHLLLPLSVNVDTEVVNTGVPLSIPFVKEAEKLGPWIEMAMSDDDKVMAGFLKAVAEGKSEELKNFISADGSYKVLDYDGLGRMLKSSYFPEKAVVAMIGKIPAVHGTGYIFFREGKDHSNPNFAILSVKQTEAGPKVQAMDDDGLWDVIQLSLNQLSLAKLDSALRKGSAPLLCLETFSALRPSLLPQPELKEELLKAIAAASAEALRSGFTGYSQGKVDKILARLPAEKRERFVASFQANAKMISHILPLGPLVVSIQKPESSCRILYFYRDPSTGRLLMTNYSQSQGIDLVLRKLLKGATVL